MKLQVGKGIDQYLSQLEGIDNLSDQAIGRAVYEGAGVVADQVRANIDKLSTSNSKSGLRPEQKKGLQDGLGISRMANEGGYVNAKLGFDGYNGLKTEKYPKGQPNAMIARTFEGGNSFTSKKPFVGPAVRKTKAAAEQKMAQVIDEEIGKIVK